MPRMMHRCCLLLPNLQPFVGCDCEGGQVPIWRQSPSRASFGWTIRHWVPALPRAHVIAPRRTPRKRFGQML